MELLSADGTLIYAEGSPYTDETLVLHGPNLDAFLPRGGDYQVRINSYSAVDYVGTLTISMDTADLDASEHPADEAHQD